MFRKVFRTAFSLTLLSLAIPVMAQHHNSNSPLDQYVEQVSELSSRARANIYFTNPQPIFRGVQVSFVNVGTGNLTFLRRDLVAAGRIPLVFARVYDSSGTGSIDFGPGWTLSAAESITVVGGKAHLISENGSTLEFIKVDDTAFQLEKDYPSDYLSLSLLDANIMEVRLRNGFIKRFELIGNAFRLVRVTDRNGNQVSITYVKDRVAKIENANHAIAILRNENGRIVSAQDDQNRSVKFSYDGKGRLIEADDIGGRAWTYSYSEDKLRDARDPLGRLNLAVVFDEADHVRSLQMPSGRIQFDFNTASRLTTVIDRKSLVSRFFQNEDGITTRVTNALGEETAIGLDSARNVISLARDGAVLELMEYDPQHRLLARHTASDAGIVDRDYSYDPRTGFLNAIRSSNGQNQSFSYDEKGNLASAGLQDGEHKFKFSRAGELIGLSESKATLTFSPDPDGLFASMTDGQNAKTALQYKAGSQLKEVIFPGGTKGTFEYQPSGLRSKLTLSDGRRAEYNYDPAGNLIASKVFDKKSKQINGQKLEMDDSYQLTRWTLFNGTVTDFKYDRNGNLTEIKKGKSVTRFEYDAVNRLVAVVTPSGQRLTYSYKPGERSLIEQHQHAAVLVEDLRDTGLTFAGQLQVTAMRPVTGLLGAARFSETLGTFQLSGSSGTEVVLPNDGIQSALKKLFLYDHAASARELRSGFNIPFNTMFMPAEYVTINCCPECYDDGGEWYCPPCGPFLPDPPSISGPSDVWYFGGITPAGYSTTITLTSSSGADTTWSIFTGSTKVNLSTTSGGSTNVTSTGTAFSSAAGDIEIDATDSYGQTGSINITSRTPTQLVTPATFNNECDGTFGYVSTLTYPVIDNLSQTLPTDTSYNEKFTGLWTVDFSSNWAGIFGNPPPTFGGSTSASVLTDFISGPPLSAGPNPTPTCSGGGPLILNINQEWRIGSDTSGLGRRVAQDNFERFLDHAFHNPVNTPFP